MEDPILKHAHTVTSQITHIVASLYVVMFFSREGLLEKMFQPSG
jgi:hypothetical protein